MALASQGPIPDGPLAIEVIAVFKRPKRLTRKRDPRERIRHDIGPCDGSNVLKAIEDGTEGTFYANDSRLSVSHVEKWWCAIGEEPHVEVRLWLL